MIYIFGGAFDPPHVGHTAIVKSLLSKKHPEKIIIIPSSERDDKKYNVSDDHRLAMLEIFVNEIHISEQIPPSSEGQKENDRKVILDDYFLKHWKGEMITKDVDVYVRKKYGEDIIHVFGSDTISWMNTWDAEGYAARMIKKIFVPRHSSGIRHCEGNEAIQNGSHAEFISASGSSGFGNKFAMTETLDCHVDVSQEQKHLLAMTEHGKIENFELFTDCHIPDVSSTELRAIIPKYTGLKEYYEEEPKFIIPGLSKRISQYILENRLYRPKLEKKPKVLVHVCCGPDVTMPILALRDEYDVVCFWYDPNIQPKEEHDKRYDAFVKVCELENIPYIKGAYDVKHFFTRIKGLEFTPEKGEKCTHCYDMRMYVAAKLAKKLHIPYYTSSLNTSPKKDLDKLFTMGHKYAEKYGVTFLDIPFRKKGGFEKSVAYTNEHDIYRQNYCGCIYSIREGGESEMKGRMVG